MATYNLGDTENADAMAWFLTWANVRSKNQNGTTNTWSRESYTWLKPAQNGGVLVPRDGDDGAPSFVIADLSHNLGSYEVKQDKRPKKP